MISDIAVIETQSLILVSSPVFTLDPDFDFEDDLPVFFPPLFEGFLPGLSGLTGLSGLSGVSGLITVCDGGEILN